jgi:hypothetical protein
MQRFAVRFQKYSLTLASTDPCEHGTADITAGGVLMKRISGPCTGGITNDIWLQCCIWFLPAQSWEMGMNGQLVRFVHITCNQCQSKPSMTEAASSEAPAAQC